MAMTTKTKPSSISGIGRLAHEEVEAARGDEHEEHRLAGDLDPDDPQAPLLLSGKLVRPLLRQARVGVRVAEPEQPTETQNGAGRSGPR